MSKRIHSIGLILFILTCVLLPETLYGWTQSSTYVDLHTGPGGRWVSSDTSESTGARTDSVQSSLFQTASDTVPCTDDLSAVVSQLSRNAMIAFENNMIRRGCTRNGWNSFVRHSHSVTAIHAQCLVVVSLSVFDIGCSPPPS